MHFRKLEVYQYAIHFLGLAYRLAAVLPKGSAGPIREQLRRAALSIPLNVAESSGKTSEEECRRYFAIARGSAMECAALVDECRALGMADVEGLREADEVLLSIVRMLSKLARR